MVNNENICHTTTRCLPWGPIVGGALVAVGLSFLLNLFSIAIGLKVFTTDSEGVQMLMFGGLVAAAIGIVASMFASGWLTGYLSRPYCDKRHMGALYGFLAWCLALIIVMFLASYIQQYVSFYARFLSGSYDAVQVGAVSATTNAAVVVKENSLVISTFIVFALFFLSAFASSLGGHCGMRHRCNEVVR